MQGGGDADTLNFSRSASVGDAAIDLKALDELQQSSSRITEFLSVSLMTNPENLL